MMAEVLDHGERVARKKFFLPALHPAEIREREKELIIRISRAAEFRDPETGAHIQRMAHYSRIIARQLGLDDAVRQMKQLMLEART